MHTTFMSEVTFFFVFILSSNIYDVCISSNFANSVSLSFYYYGSNDGCSACNVVENNLNRRI